MPKPALFPTTRAIIERVHSLFHERSERTGAEQLRYIQEVLRKQYDLNVTVRTITDCLGTRLEPA